MPGAESLARHARGHHTIFLGMAPGVGKTYRMLQEGHAKLDAGRDIVIGLVEAHGREATAQVAEEVEAKRLVTEVFGTREESMARESPKAVAERLLALVEPYPAAQRLVRRAWRSAQRLGADLDLLWVAPAGRELDAERERQLTALRQLASVLGATLLTEAGDDVAETVARVARERGTTYILLGRSRPARGLRRLRVPLPERLMAALPAVDVRIVADRSTRHEATP